MKERKQPVFILPCCYP